MKISIKNIVLPEKNKTMIKITAVPLKTKIKKGPKMKPMKQNQCLNSKTISV
jgi:hypothetical protein